MNNNLKFILQLGLVIMSIFFGNIAKSEQLDLIRLNLSGTIFTIEVPPHKSKDFPKKVTGTNFNIRDEHLYRNADVFKPLLYVWDYNGSWFQGLRGTLMMAIFIERKDNDTTIDLTNWDALGQYYLNVIHSRHDKHNERSIQISQPERVVNLPYELLLYKSTSALQWLTYKLGGSENQEDFITPLGTSHILRVTFQIMPTGTGRETGWLEEIDNKIREIMNTTQLR